MGKDSNGRDSLAIQVAPESHWPSLHALICVVNSGKKGTSSTAGMQETVLTSELLKSRIKDVVPSRMSSITQAILAKDFDSFAKITMQDSNQFHAVCLDTFPPIFYLNDVSRAIIAIITELNRVSVEATGHLVAAYTFDAGPNAVIYTESENIKTIIQLLLNYFPIDFAASPFNDSFQLFGVGHPSAAPFPKGFNENVSRVWEKDSIKGLIHTKIGDGPRVLGEEESLLNVEGIPKTLA